MSGTRSSCELDEPPPRIAASKPGATNDDDRPYLPEGFTLENPGFESAGRIHDWRNHVGENAMRIWGTLNDEQRLALAMDARDRAGAEEWD